MTKSSAKHQSMLRPWVLQHQPWPSPSAWSKTRSLHGCRNFYLLILPSLSFSLSLSLFLLLLFLDRTDVCSPLLCLFPTQFRAKIDFSRKKKEKCLLCCHRHTTVIAGPTCLIAHLLAPHDRAQSQRTCRKAQKRTCAHTWAGTIACAHYALILVGACILAKLANLVIAGS